MCAAGMGLAYMTLLGKWRLTALNGSVDICVVFSIRLGEITLLFLHVLIVFSGFIISENLPINIATI
jgi:hypothetical protein